jgi:glycosyltransferase involved in cell wall biosynthesis
MNELPVSIIVSTVDRPAMLVRCLNSLMKLEYHNMEIVVIDNGSKQSFIPEINYRCRTRFFHLPVRGISYARNFGVHYASGDILAFIDDDAFADPDWLRNAASHFHTPTIACVTGRIIPVDSNGAIVTEPNPKFPNVDERLYFNRANFSPVRMSAGTGSNFLIKRTMMAKYRFNELLGAGVPVGGAEEQMLFFQVIQGGGTIVFEPASIVYHEYPKEEVTSKKRNLRNSTSRIAFLVLLFLKGGGQRIPLLVHAFKRIIGFPTPHLTGPGNFHWRSLYLGPLSLFQSAILARKNRSRAAQKAELLQEFPGENSVAKPAEKF